MKLGSKYGCHQLAERSFFFKGYQFPVCARCSGVLLGNAVFIASAWLYYLPFSVCVFFILVMLIDWLIQYFKWKNSTNPRRFITGLLCGYAMFACIAWLIIYLM